MIATIVQVLSATAFAFVSCRYEAEGKQGRALLCLAGMVWVMLSIVTVPAILLLKLIGVMT